MHLWIRLWALLLMGFGMFGCDQGTDITLGETSPEIKNSDPIVIGIITSPHNHDALIEGANLAVAEINKMPLFQKHPLKIKAYTLPQSENSEMNLIKKMVGIRSLLGVVNAVNTSYTTLADRILLLHKKIHIIVANSSMSVTQDSPLSFRIIPNDRIASRQLVARMEWNWRNVIVIQERNDKSLMQAKAFLEAVAEANIRVSQVVSFFPWEKDIRQLLWNLRERISKNQEFLDAIFVACSHNDVVHIVKQVRSMNIGTPIISSVDIHDITRLKAINKEANSLLMATNFNPDSDEPLVRGFVERFKEKYPGSHPTTWTARGSDAIWMIARGIENANTLNPWEVASEMLLVEKWQGVSGQIIFNIDGDLNEFVPYYLKQYCNGRFVYLSDDQSIPQCLP